MEKLSATLRCQMIVEERKKNNQIVYNFGLGANPLEPNKKYLHSVSKFLNKNHYTSPFGINSVQNTIKNLMSVENYEIDKVLFGNGLKEMIYILQSVFDGTIVHITPAWVSYKGQLKILNKLSSLREFHTTFEEKYKINLLKFDSFLGEIRNRNENILIIFNNPNNPTGVVYTENEIKELAKIMQKHNCIVLADEIYLNLSYTKDTCSIAKYIPNNVIRGSSLSKDIGCGGHRLGWLTFPKSLEDLMYKCNNYISSMFSCTTTPLQYGLVDFLQDKSEFNNICLQTRTIFKAMIEKVCLLLDKTDVKYIKPKSAWYIFLDFENYRSKLENIGIKNNNDLNYYLLNKGFISVGGNNFGHNTLSCRVSLVDLAEYENGIKYLIKILEEL